MSQGKQKIKEMMVERMNLKLDPGEIGDDQPIFGDAEGSLGLDSIDALDLVVAIYEAFDVEIQDSDMHVFENVDTLYAFIEEKRVAKEAS